jgi:probable blue pigment (indigoidine) exporter
MEAKWRWLALTAIAPIAWGSTYFVTRQFLPGEDPLWGATIRALPAGLILLALARRLPTGSWWWRSLVLGVLNFGGFFALLYLTALWLPGSIASSLMALAPLVLGGFGWAMLGERPTSWMGAGAVMGIAGVLLVVGTGGVGITLPGVLTSLTALLMSSVGAVLNKKWGAGLPVLATTAWQAMAGGILLLIAAVIFEGTPPALSAPAVAGFAYISVVATAIASLCWFYGLTKLPAATVGIVGLLNPVTGVLLGTAFAGEQLGWVQVSGIVLVLVGILIGRRTSAPRVP